MSDDRNGAGEGSKAEAGDILLASPKESGILRTSRGPRGEANTWRHTRTGEGSKSSLLRQQHLQVSSDIAGSGGAPRLATTWETEARSVLIVFARIVNTEGPRA